MKKSAKFSPLRERSRGSVHSTASFNLNGEAGASGADSHVAHTEQSAPVPQEPWYSMLIVFMYDPRVQLFTMFLVLIVFIAILIELLVEAQLLLVGSQPTQVARGFQYVTLSIMLLFLVEIIIKAITLRHRFLLQRGNVADAVLVLVTLVLELLFFESNAGASEFASLIIVGRWWRVVALAREYVGRLRRDAQSRLRCEFELRMNAENEVLILRAARDALEMERNALRELLKRYVIDVNPSVLQAEQVSRSGFVPDPNSGDDVPQLISVAASSDTPVVEQLNLSTSSFAATRVRELFEIDASVGDGLRRGTPKAFDGTSSALLDPLELDSV